MSSYCTFYLKKGNNEPIDFSCYSRATEVYGAFHDYVTYVGNDDDIKYTTLTNELCSNILNDINEEINKLQKRITQYAKHAKDPDTIEMIIDLKEELDNKNFCKDFIEFMQDIVSHGVYNNFEILANID